LFSPTKTPQAPPAITRLIFLAARLLLFAAVPLWAATGGSISGTVASGANSDTVIVTSDTSAQVETSSTHLGEVVSGSNLTALP
jgi:hypothetical protein